MSTEQSTHTKRPHNFQDLTGMRFGRLVVRSFAGRRGNNPKTATTLWLCDCDCGKASTVGAPNLKRGMTVSCGCAKPLPRPCVVAGCCRQACARGLCNKHYYAAKRTGGIDPKPCSVPDCGRPSYHHGWCNMHYRRWANSGGPMIGPAVPRGTTSANPCCVAGCLKNGRGFLAGGIYCRTHFDRVKRHGDPHKVLRVGNGQSTPSRRKVMRSATQKRYHATPHGRLRLRFNAAKKRAMKYGCDWVTGISKDVFIAIYNEPVCGICFRPVPEAERSIDHIIPLSKGGGNRPDNLQLAHLLCNLQKNNRQARPVCLAAAPQSGCRRHTGRAWLVG